MDVHRAARIAAAAHGGQVVLSDATRQLVASRLPAGVSVLDLGWHQLKDIEAPERIYQLVAPGLEQRFPPLKSMSSGTGLPMAPTAMVGREHELAQLRAVVTRPGIRLVTLTGPGGVGKTRLALEAAAGLPDAFPDGIWWAALASVRREEQVLGALAQALGVRERPGAGLEQALYARLQGRRMLVVLDNAEHLLPDLAEAVMSLLAAGNRLEILATSRERLQLPGEQVFEVPALNGDDAVALLRERAAAMGVQIGQEHVVDRLCARLDRLPLALELAAARLRLFSPAQLLGRIESRLDLLKGLRGVEPRHRTLRATIEWSHDLLSEPEQVLFRRLAVFAGGCTLDAAESVCDPELEALEGLLDKNLLQRRDDTPEPRLSMLESIRDFGAERLALAGETLALRARHADYFRTLANRMDAALRAGEPEEGPVWVLAADIGNLRAAVEFGLETGDTQLVREITAALHMYWVVRGRYTEARSWLDRALTFDHAPDLTRQRLLSALGTIAYAQGDHAAAVAASDEAASLALQLAGQTERFEHLQTRAMAALRRDDLQAAEGLLREALTVALEAGNGVGTSWCRLCLASVANHTGRPGWADELLAENLPFVRARGQSRCEGYTLAGIATSTLRRGRPEDCAADALLGARRALQIGDRGLAVGCLELCAAAEAAAGDQPRAAAILAATAAARETMGIEPDADDEAIRQRALQLLGPQGQAAALGSAEGRMLDLPAMLSLAAGAADTPG